MTFGMTLFTFMGFFVQIEIFSIKIVIQNLTSRYKINYFYVPNGRKATKKTCSGHIGKFTIKNPNSN